MGREIFQEVIQGPILEYFIDRIALQDSKVTFDDLEFVRVIGHGGFGLVQKVRSKLTGVNYALKSVRKSEVEEQGRQEALVSERSILAEVDHPFIVKFVRSFRS